MLSDINIFITLVTQMQKQTSNDADSHTVCMFICATINDE